MRLFSERLLGATGFASLARYQWRHGNAQMVKVRTVERWAAESRDFVLVWLKGSENELAITRKNMMLRDKITALHIVALPHKCEHLLTWV